MGRYDVVLTDRETCWYVPSFSAKVVGVDGASHRILERCPVDLSKVTAQDGLGPLR